MKDQPAKYLPGTFWEVALKEISTNYAEKGILNLRNFKKNLSFFVPTYGSPGSGLNEEIIERFKHNSYDHLTQKQKEHLNNFFNGYSQALADFRTFSSGNTENDKINLLQFSESKIGNPKEHFRFEDKYYSRSSLNYLLGLTFFKKIVPNFIPNRVLEIGGGFGTLGEILAKTMPINFKYINLDLPPMFLISEEYIANCFSGQKYKFYKNAHENLEHLPIEDLPNFTFLPNWRIENLRGKIDLFVNFISFQEMEPLIVKNYVKHIAKLNPNYVLLRNLKEGKQKAKGGGLGVNTPIYSEDYITYFEKYDLIARNVIPFGYVTSDGYNSELLILKRKN